MERRAEAQLASQHVLRRAAVADVLRGVGQLFIFYTIRRYGPLVFATIQTVRQFLSVVLSIVFFAHPINFMMGIGIMIVFVALGAQIFDKWLKRSKSGDKLHPPTPPSEIERIRDAENRSEHEAAEAAEAPHAALLRSSAANRF